MIKDKIMMGMGIVIAILIMTLFVYKQYGEAQSQKAHDYKELLSSEREKRYRTREGIEHLKKQVEELNSGKSLKQDPEWNALLKDVKDIKASRIVAASKTTVSSEYHVNTVIKDSVINDTVKISCLQPYKDDWVSLSGCDGDFAVKTKDSISSVIYEGKRKTKILFFRVGKRELESEVINYNPHSTIKYDRRVIIKKKD